MPLINFHFEESLYPDLTVYLCYILYWNFIKSSEIVGECFLELKGIDANLEAEPNLDQIFDGYEWKGPVRRQLLTLGPGAMLEVSQILGGQLDEAKSEGRRYSMCRYEYRLAGPQNRLFLIQYLMVDNEGKLKAAPEEAPKPFPNPIQMPISRPLPTMPNQVQMRPKAPLPMPNPVLSQSAKLRVPLPVASSSAIPSRQPSINKPFQKEDAAFLPIDDFDPNTRIDLAFERLKFQKGLLAKLFCPTNLKTRTADETPQLLELLTLQTECSQKEVENLEKILKSRTKNDEIKRKSLRQLFNDLQDATSVTQLDQIKTEYEQMLGYALQSEINS